MKKGTIAIGVGAVALLGVGYHYLKGKLGKGRKGASIPSAPPLPSDKASTSPVDWSLTDVEKLKEEAAKRGYVSGEEPKK